MKRLLWHYSFIVPAVLFLLHQITQHLLGVPISFLDAYLDPFCLGALTLYGVRIERKLLFNRSLPIVDTLLATVFLIVVSEGLFPYLSERFVRDWWDAVAIASGAMWFVLTEPKMIN